MEYSYFISLLLTSLLTATILCITSVEAQAFRRHIATSLPPDTSDWESGLREAVYQTLIQENYSHSNLREYLSIAPILRQHSSATPFGDIAVLARGQLYFTKEGFEFIQDPNSYDCDECDERSTCGATNCHRSQWPNHEKLLVLWTVRRIRRRDRNHMHHYEIQYTISPIYSDALVSRNGFLNYNIAGHVYVKNVERAEDYLPNRAVDRQGCKRCNYHRAFVDTPPTNPNNDRYYLPPQTMVTDVDRAREKGGFSLGVGPDGYTYELQSLPKHHAHRHFYVDDDRQSNLQKEIELYQNLLEALAGRGLTTESSRYITTPPPISSQRTTRVSTSGVTTAIPSYVTNAVSSSDDADELPEISSTPPQSTVNIELQHGFTAPVFDKTALSHPPKKSKAQTAFTMPHLDVTASSVKPIVKVTSARRYNKVTSSNRSPVSETATTMRKLIQSTMPFRASPNYIKYSEPDPLYQKTPDIAMYATTKQNAGTTVIPSSVTNDEPIMSYATKPMSKVSSLAITKPTVSPYSQHPLAVVTISTLTTQLLKKSTAKLSKSKGPKYPTQSTAPINTIQATTQGDFDSFLETAEPTQLQETATSKKSLSLDQRFSTINYENRTPPVENEITRAPVTSTTATNYEVVEITTVALKTMENDTTSDATMTPMTTENIIVQRMRETFSTSRATESTHIDGATSSITNSNDYVTNTKPTEIVSEVNESSYKEEFPISTTYMTDENETESTTLGTTMPQSDETFQTTSRTLFPVTVESSEEKSTVTVTLANNSNFPNGRETITPFVTTMKMEKEIDLLDEIFGTISDFVPSSTTTKSTTKRKKTKDIDELFDDGEVPTSRIIFSNFYMASTAEPTTSNPVSDHRQSVTNFRQTTSSENENLEPLLPEITTPNAPTEMTEQTDQYVVHPTSQSYSTSISFEVNKRNASSPAGQENNSEDQIKAALTEIDLNDTEFMVYKAELPRKKNHVTDSSDEESSTNNKFDTVALMLVNHARSIDYLNNKHNSTKPKRKHRKSKHHNQKKVK